MLPTPRAHGQKGRQADTHMHTHTAVANTVRSVGRALCTGGRRVDVMDRIRIIHRLGRSGGRWCSRGKALHRQWPYRCGVCVCVWCFSIPIHLQGLKSPGYRFHGTQD